MIENPAVVAGLVRALSASALEGAAEAERQDDEPIAWDVRDGGHGLLLWTDDERAVMAALPCEAVAQMLHDLQAALARGDHRRRKG